MKKISKEIKNEIKELTNWNHHGEARTLITKELMLVDLYKEYNEINLEHELIGNLTNELRERRSAADAFLFSIASEYKELF